jgi:hypothetical protein
VLLFSELESVGEAKDVDAGVGGGDLDVEFATQDTVCPSQLVDVDTEDVAEVEEEMGSALLATGHVQTSGDHVRRPASSSESFLDGHLEEVECDVHTSLLNPQLTRHLLYPSLPVLQGNFSRFLPRNSMKPADSEPLRAVGRDELTDKTVASASRLLEADLRDDRPFGKHSPAFGAEGIPLCGILVDILATAMLTDLVRRH